MYDKRVHPMLVNLLIEDNIDVEEKVGGSQQMSHESVAGMP